MAIGCRTRRLLNVAFLRNIVEPKPTGGTQQRRGAPAAKSMTDKTIPEARCIATAHGLAGLDDKQVAQFAKPPHAICLRACRRI